MNKIILDDKLLSLYEYMYEEEFEKTVVEHSIMLFGSKSIYVDVKKKIGDSILTIPDGYLVDFTFSKSPQLYIVENELIIHDPYKHIGQQLLMHIPDNSEDQIDADDIDTIIVPANEDGFNEVFIGEDCWYAIRISSAMIEKIKYIAGYQTAPVSAITYYAEVDNVKKYKDTDKYIIYFKDKAKRVGPLELVPKPKGRVKAPQGPRYTTIKRLKAAKNLDEVF